MKAKLVAVLVLSFCHSVLLGGEPAQPALRVKPIQIVSNETLPEKVPIEVAPMGFKSGFQISYLLEGQNLAGVRSLTIDSIKTPDGTEISKDRSGAPAYELGPFSRTSPDGKYAVFSLEVNESQFGKVERLVVQGHVTAIVGTTREEKSVELNATEVKPQKLGPYSIEAMQGDEGRFMIGPEDPDDVRIIITGPQRKLVRVQFKDGNAQIPTQASWDDQRRTCSLPKPKSGKIAVTLSYWSDVKEVAVPLGR
jgi:hypothetical protein